MRMLMACCVLSVAASCVPKAWAPYGSASGDGHGRTVRKYRFSSPRMRELARPSPLYGGPAGIIPVRTAEVNWVMHEMQANRLVQRISDAGFLNNALQLNEEEELSLSLNVKKGIHKLVIKQHGINRGYARQMTAELKRLGILHTIMDVARQIDG